MEPCILEERRCRRCAQEGTDKGGATALTSKGDILVASKATADLLQELESVNDVFGAEIGVAAERGGR